MLSDLELVQEAIKAREGAYAPYSGFLVGAALLTKSGKLFTGCNIENAAFSPTVCGERTAFFKAISEGERDFAAIAVAGWKRGEEPMKKRGFAYPCGVCRQVMMEFCNPKEFRVIVTENAGSFQAHTLSEILPHGFGPDAL